MGSLNDVLVQHNLHDSTRFKMIRGSFFSNYEIIRLKHGGGRKEGSAAHDSANVIIDAAVQNVRGSEAPTRTARKPYGHEVALHPEQQKGNHETSASSVRYKGRRRRSSSHKSMGISTPHQIDAKAKDGSHPE